MCECLVLPDSATPWTVACQAPLSMGFPRQEYWSRVSFPSPRGKQRNSLKKKKKKTQSNGFPMLFFLRCNTLTQCLLR